MFRLEQTFRIMFSDCDPAKIMFYPRYFEWFDRASQELFNAVDLSWDAIWEARFGGLPVYGQLLGRVSNAVWAGAALGLVGGLVGVFVMQRDMAFAVHGISELSFAGAAAALP